MEIPSAVQSVNRIVGTMHSIAMANQPIEISIGQVVQEPPELIIAWNGIALTKEQLYVDQFLLPNYQRSAKGDTKMDNVKGDIKTVTQNRKGGHDKPSFVSHNHKVNDSYKADAQGEYEASVIYTDSGLAAGDFVLILPVDNAQKFAVLSKLVYLPDFDFSAGKESLNDKI